MPDPIEWVCEDCGWSFGSNKPSAADECDNCGGCFMCSECTVFPVEEHFPTCSASERGHDGPHSFDAFDDEFGLTMDPCEHPSINGDVCAACGATCSESGGPDPERGKGTDRG